VKWIWNRTLNTHRATEHKHAARQTQIHRQIEKKTYTHDIDSWTQTNREGLCVREIEAIIGAKVGDSHSFVPTQRLGCCANDSERNILGTQLNKSFFHAVRRVWLWGGGCERWVRGWVGRVWLCGKGECSVVRRTVADRLFVCGRSVVSWCSEFGRKLFSRQICKWTLRKFVEKQKGGNEKHTSFQKFWKLHVS